MYDTGDRYEGEFKKGVREGMGKYTSVDGWFYLGQYKSGERFFFLFVFFLILVLLFFNFGFVIFSFCILFQDMVKESIMMLKTKSTMVILSMFSIFFSSFSCSSPEYNQNREFLKVLENMK